MSRDGRRGLSLEERILWGKVARSTEPLPGRSIDPDWTEETSAVDDGGGQPAHEALSGRQAQPPAAPRITQEPAIGSRRMDAPLRRKLGKGRVPIEGRIDLHGLSQGEAYGLLLAFFHRAYAEGRRNLLVVTGKGRSPGSEGALRRAVPAWLSTPAFRGLVHSHSDASRHHGGSGALYVRLRRPGQGA